MIAAGLILVVAALLAWWEWHRRWLTRRTKSHVTVHTVDERSLQGVLAGTGPDGLVLHAVKYLDTEAEVPLRGEVFVPKSQVSFIQRHAEGGSK